jgi:hypothetical protein
LYVQAIGERNAAIRAAIWSKLTSDLCAAAIDKDLGSYHEATFVRVA